MRSPANKSNKSQVDKFIDTSYDKVAIVADNLDAILAAEDNIENTLRYLGTSSGIPLTRLDGSPIQDSDYYLDTTTKSFFYYVEISDEWIESDTEGVEQSAEEARLSAEAALISETNAAASESLVEAHKDAAGISEGNALLSEQLAHDWAEKADDTDVTDVGTRSAKHHANAAKASADLTNANVVITNADAASTNADALSTASDVIATNLDVGITNANVLLTNADVVTTHDDVVISTSNKDATNADVISTNADALLASTSRDEAELAKIAAGESEINSAASESNAATSETNAKNSEDNASAHESASLLSRDAAALSEANAKSSEISASNSKTSASNSKDSASLSEANASTSESNALQSATESGLARDESVSAKDIAVNAKDSAQLSESNAAVSESNASDSEANSLNYYNLTEASKDAAESAASTAAAHANFDGLWINTGTKAVSIPYAVEHTDAIWMLVNPAGLSDVSTSEPSVVNPDWSQIGSTGGTATDAARLANQLPSYYLDPDNHDDSTSVNKWITQGEKDHLGTIETGATADQTASEIEGLYEGQADTNKFTDLDKALVSTSLQSVRAGTNVVINGGDPINPVISVIPSSSVGNTARSYFTGDVESVGAGNFLLASQVDKGTVAEVSQQVSVDDLQKSYFGQDFLGAVLPAMRVVVGTYTAGISVQYSSSSAHIKFYYEIYLADADGNVIDSGIASESVGDLGVRPLNVLTSGSTELPAGDIRNVPVTGTLSEPYDFPEGHRIRHHFAAEKLNTAGGVVNIDLFSGSNHNSYVDNNIPIDSDNLTNVSGVTGASVSDALESLDNNISTKADSSHTHVESDITDLDKYTKAEVDAKESSIQTSIGTKADSSHTHTKSEIIDFNEGDYATSAQGAKADTALQSGDNISELTNDSGFITNADLPPSAVVSVNGESGIVVLDQADIGLDQVDNTSDLDKQVSSATLDLISKSVKLDRDALCSLFEPNKPVTKIAGGLSVTRSGEATYIDRYGVLKTAGIDELRETADGYQIESVGSTNAWSYSEDFTHGSWGMSSSRVELSPADDLSNLLAYKIIPDALQGTKSITHAYEPVAGDTQSMTFIVKAAELGILNIGSNITQSNSYYLSIINLFDGSIISGGGNITQFRKIEKGAYVITSTFPTENGGFGSPTIQIYSNSQEQKWTSNDSDGIIFYAGQIENKTTPSSYIPTTDAPATRAPDIVSMPYENNVPRGDQPYTIIFKGIIDGYTSFNRLFGSESNDPNSRIYSFIGASGGIYHTNGIDSTIAKANSITFGEEFTYIITSDGINYTSYLDGVLQASASVISPATELPNEMAILQCDTISVNSNGKCSLFKTLPYAITADEVKLIS